MTSLLTLGSFDFAGDASSYSTAFLGEGTSWGSPAAREAVIRSLLQDGSVVVTEGHDNREIVVRLEIRASDSAGLADGAADLFAELGKANTLTYTPGDGWGAPTAFDVLTSSLDPLPDDLAEVRGIHYYLVRLVCLPFGRSTTETTVTPTGTNIGTARQKSYSFDVEGSARTEASLHVSGGSSLGNTLIYTYPGPVCGMIPLRQHRTGGGATSDVVTLVSGTYDTDLTTAFESTVPKADVPDGTYIILGRVRSVADGSTTLTVTARTLIDGQQTRASLSSQEVPLDLITTYEIKVLTPTPIRLPTALVVDESTAEIMVSIGDEAGGTTVWLDEAWLVEVGDGALSIPDTFPLGLGPSATHIWVDPPTTDYPLPRMLRGTQPDLSDAFSVGDSATSWMRHRLAPGTNTALVVTDDDTSQVLDVSWWARSHTWAPS